MAPRIVVRVQPVDGGHQAVCQAPDCTAGPDGAPWRSAVHVVKVGAEDDARGHRQWHRLQQDVPRELAELIAASGLADGVPLADGVHIADLPDLTWHVTRPLGRADIYTIGDLRGRSDEQLLALPEFGPSRLAKLKAALSAVAP